MLIALCLLAVGISVPLTGGRLGQLRTLRLQARWALVLAFGLQLLAISFAPRLRAAPLVHIASYALALFFLWRNRRVPGMWLIAAGGALNALVILANGGVMPASPKALAAAGLAAGSAGFENSSVVAQPRLAFLGDVFATPSWFPAPNVFSLGDVLLILGFGYLLHRVCRADGGVAASQAERPRTSV